ncbi:hypothetical protein OUZ56_014610 [Daphnia magna]|uniref:Uncharacterized protein n=1 Tax=Daphnia magna TaxID=35525 RepID=A0ABR0AKA1_9CRUS|nr:hypothetical protein OUZ56_014610 [Daphnia magna]
MTVAINISRSSAKNKGASYPVGCIQLLADGERKELTYRDLKLHAPVGPQFRTNHVRNDNGTEEWTNKKDMRVWRFPKLVNAKPGKLLEVNASCSTM